MMPGLSLQHGLAYVDWYRGISIRASCLVVNQYTIIPQSCHPLPNLHTWPTAKTLQHKLWFPDSFFVILDFFCNWTFLGFINVICRERKSQRKKKHIQTFTPKILKTFKYLGSIIYSKGWPKPKIPGFLNYSTYLKRRSNYLIFTTGTAEGGLHLESEDLGMDFDPVL